MSDSALPSLHHALFFSDLHLGWSVLEPSHHHLLRHLPDAAGDAGLIVMNGDIIDPFRRPDVHRMELVAQLTAIVDTWRREGRHVLYIEGNHDPADTATGTLRPDRWHLDLEGPHGERIRVLHGHRFSPQPYRSGRYEGWGRHLLILENRLQQLELVRALYPYGPGWLVGGIGVLEDRTWRPRFPQKLAPHLPEVDVLIHGHFHFGPGSGRIGPVATWKTGAWASRGHLGSVDRMLRFRNGRFERLELSGTRWKVSADGR